MKIRFNTATFSFTYNDALYMVSYEMYPHYQYQIIVASEIDEQPLSTELVGQLETTHPTHFNAFRKLEEVLKELGRI